MGNLTSMIRGPVSNEEGYEPAVGYQLAGHNVNDYREDSQDPSMVVVCVLHSVSRIFLTSFGSSNPATSLTLILERIELSFPSNFAPKRGADLRVEKSELCTPGW